MREILFRATDLSGVNNRSWIFGSLDTTENEYTIMIYPDRFGNKCRIFVDPKTVGQYTGLTDKNGKKIFEGDIVQYSTYDDFDCQSIVKFGEYKQDGSDGEYKASDCLGFYVEVDNFTCPDWCDNEPERFHDYLKQQSLAEIASQCEIIGNIHDNPELLEVEK